MAEDLRDAKRTGRPSLRELNRMRTRDAITEAAIQLGMRLGIQAVRVEDIAAEAGVSTRTFNNYFSNKYEAMAARHVERMHHAAVALRALPDDQPLWDCIVQSITESWRGLETHVPPQNELAELQMLLSNRNTQIEILQTILDENSEFAAAIESRLPDSAESKIYARQLAAALTAVTQVAFDQFNSAKSSLRIFDSINEALARLREGFPAPAIG